MTTTNEPGETYPYKVCFAGEALKELEKLGPSQRKRVLRAIAKKLQTKPIDYGEPLVKDLFPFRKLRVGDCRVIYRVVATKVHVIVLAVGKRREGDAEDIYTWLTPEQLGLRLAAVRLQIEQLDAL